LLLFFRDKIIGLFPVSGSIIFKIEHRIFHGFSCSLIPPDISRSLLPEEGKKREEKQQPLQGISANYNV